MITIHITEFGVNGLTLNVEMYDNTADSPTTKQEETYAELVVADLLARSGEHYFMPKDELH
jgi:hypothetical protein